MIGHGRPASLASALARTTIVLCACLCGRVAAQNLPAPPPEPIQLRITWGGGDASRWTGRITVGDGSLSNIRLLGPDADAVGSIWLEEGQVRVATLSAHKFDSVEIAAQSSASAKLQIELTPDDKGSPPRLEVPLADLPRHPYQVRLDDRGNTLEVQIVPQPALRIAPSRDPLIFAPGEQCSFEMSTAIANLAPGTELVIQTTLSPLSPLCRKEPPWKSDPQRLAVPVDGHPKAMLDVPLPKTEGVYTIHVAVSRPSGFARVWAASARLAERSFEVVVLNTHTSEPTVSARWESVLEIDPTNPRWFDRLPSWTQVQRIPVPGLNHGALGNFHAAVVELPLGRFIELPPTVPPADPHWQAYSLPLEAVGLPHMLEIDFPADSEQHFGISIVEPNANGFISGINRDAGVYVEGLGRSEAKQKQTQRFVFWPRTQAPLLVVSNLHPSAAAHFGQVRVFKRSTNQLSPAPPGYSISRDRLIAAYLARPTVAETFGASRPVDIAAAASGLTTETTDDSETAYESATRLADYLRYSGYNSAIVGVKNERPPVSVSKPLDVDGTELMLRVFDREDLAIMPAIEFAAPLLKLESLRRTNDPHASGLEWVGRDGRTWLEANGTRKGLAPYYNLLDQSVQQAMLESVRDLVARYGGHRAFAGVAVQLSGDGYAQLPPLDWGLDDATIARFAHDKGIQLPDSGPDRFAARHALLTGKHADAWRSWRAQQISEFYAKVASLVRGNGDRRLVLTTENVFADPLSERMRPNLLADKVESRVVSTLLDVGIDRQSLERLPGVVLCPTRYVEPMTSLPDRATDLELNEAFALWRQPSTPAQSRATVLYHRPLRQRLSSFEIARTPWRVAGEMQLVCQPLSQGLSVRQPYLEALAEHDPAMIIDGGELLPLGQEDVLRDVRQTLALLPTSAEVTEVAKQPIIVRTYSDPNRTTVVAMNMSPWHCDATVTVDVPQATTLERLSIAAANDPGTTKSIALPAGRQPWAAPLGPYEMSVVRIPIASAKVVDIQVGLSPANAELAAKLADLANRDLTAPSDYRVLPNPSFEPIGGAGRVPGWHLSGNSGTAVAELDATKPQDGKTSLYFRCDGQSAVIESDPFPAPPTGQLAMTVYARGQNLGPQTELRLVLEADQEGNAYRRAARVTAADLQHPNGEWGGSVAILVPDLPLRSHSQMRIAFELTGPGEVWLDNVKLHDLLFPLNFYPDAQREYLQLSKQIHAAKSAFEAGQVSDCVSIVDGYWPRFILTYRPPDQPKIAVKTQPLSPVQTNEGQEPAAGLRDQFKRFVPILR